MGQFVSAEGVIVKGDFQGCYVWKWDEEKYYIVGDGVHPTVAAATVKGKPKYEISLRLVSDFFKLEHFFMFIASNNRYTLNSDVIDKYVEVSSSQNGPDPSAIAKGTFYGGAAFGAALGMASQTSSASIAVYLKDGKKMLIEFYSIANAEKFKQNMFAF